MASANENRLSSIEAAKLLNITPGTLRNWRSENAGPPWHFLRSKTRRKGKGSRPRLYYLKHEVEAFIKGG
jgi:hypothetical protein